MRPLVAAAALTLIGAGPATQPAATPPASARPATAVATFAGGCFWCVETAFEGLRGILSVTSGYTGGTTANPKYEETSAGTTGHAEAVEILYDPARIRYEELLDILVHNIDPTVANRQFCDVGSQYRSAIFVRGPAERKAAEAALAEAGRKLGVPIKTQIAEAGPFYPAEEYHQDYYKKNPVHYRAYRLGCGRDARLAALWGKDAPHH